MAPRKKIHLWMRNGTWVIDLTRYDMTGMIDPCLAAAMRWCASRTHAVAVQCVV